MVLSKSPKLESTGGKSPSYYYELYFQRHINEMRFYKKYYSYSNLSPAYLSVGDTMDLWIEHLDVATLKQSDKEIDIINISVKGKPFYDIAERNADVLVRNKKLMLYSLLAFIASLLICIVKHRRNKVEIGISN